MSSKVKKAGKATKPPKGLAKALTKSQLATELAAGTGLTKAQVNAMFDALGALVGKELKAGRPITVPGLVKILLISKPATPARSREAFGETILVKAKPARKVIKVRALKALKDMA